MIGVNIRLFSNVQIAKVFLRDSTGKFDIRKPINLSALAWREVKDQFGIDPDSILRPKTRIISWNDAANEVLVNVTGTFENDEEFSQELRIKLASVSMKWY
ncbi:MAG: hypothetical protein IPL46_25280 [Saprospiraceae bacterium]|nr:hypothetical protein [Saprospiraceae bacterium]